MISPYAGKDIADWKKITLELIKKHPLSADELKNVVLNAWDDIFSSRIGSKPYFMGKDIFPKPQILGFFLHEIIPLEFQNMYPGKWRVEKTSNDKDLVFIDDDHYSIEIKTSSNPKSIYGNRSYAQKGNASKKSKSGYYLAVNFEKISEKVNKPKILKIRFGWLDHEDWMGQKAATGQQARLSREVETLKLIELYSSE